MLEAIATIAILCAGMLVEGILTVIALKVNIKVVDREFQAQNSQGENS